VIVLREIVGAQLRRRRHEQGRSLRDVSQVARVSLGYLSEIERGQKEASSELLAAICGALEVPLSDLLATASDDVAALEVRPEAGSAVARLGRPDAGAYERDIRDLGAVPSGTLTARAIVAA